MKFSEEVASKLPKGLVSQDVIVEEIAKVALQIFQSMGNSNLVAKKKISYLFNVDQDFLSDVMIEYKDLQKKLN